MTLAPCAAMRTSPWLVLGTGLLGGCSAASSAPKAAPEPDSGILIIPHVDASPPPKDAGARDAHVAVDSGPTGPTCASPDASTSQQCGTLSWAVSPTAARARNHHVTLTYDTPSAGTVMYAFGGVNADLPINNVDRVPINADGSLGTWVADQALPFDVGGLVGEIVSGVVVVAGGNTLTGYTATAFASVLNADGSLAGWKDAPALNEPRMHAGSISRGNTMWIMGGFNDDTEYSDIIRATVSPDGTVSAWQPAGQLPDTMSHFTVSLVGDDIYLTGGLDSTPLGNPPDLATTWHGTIQSDGTLGGWVPWPRRRTAPSSTAATSPSAAASTTCRPRRIAAGEPRSRPTARWARSKR